MNNVYMKVVGQVFIFLTLFSCSTIKLDKQTVKQSKTYKLAEKFVQGFNSGNADSIEIAVRQVFTDEYLSNNGGSKAYAVDRLELYRTYGPLEFEFIDSTDKRPIVWYKGKASYGWVGFQFQFSDSLESKAASVTTWRARPISFPEHKQTEKTVADSLKYYLESLANNDLFSGSVVLSHQGKILVNSVWGNDKRKVPSPIDNTTLFHTASVTKLFTAVIVMQLVQEGLVTLNDTLGKYIPEYPQPYNNKVRIIHLLTHTSGIELDDDVEYLKMINSANNVEDLLSAQLLALKDRKPLFEPGSEYDYSSEGFDLLGVIAERVTKEKYKKIIEDRILKPANMEYTKVYMPKDKENYAIGLTSLQENLQQSDVGELKNSTDILPKSTKPSSGIWSNAYDLHLFMQAILSNKLLSEDWTNKMLKINIVTFELPKYGIKSWVGLGIQGEELWGTETLGHGGVVPGFSSAIEYLPENEWMLTVTSNTGEATGFLVFQRFLELTANYKNSE